MIYKQIISEIERMAMQEPDVNMIVPEDISLLNAIPNAKYGVFGWVPSTHNVTESGAYTRYSFTFYYADKLFVDGSNETDLQSKAFVVLNNILRGLNDFFDVENWSLTGFRRFTDECAGATANVVIMVQNEINCYDNVNVDNVWEKVENNIKIKK